MDFSTLRNDLPDLIKASYEPQKVAEADLAKKGYVFDKDLSSMNAKVFLDPNKEPVILQRGSHTLKDFIDDALIGVGLGRYGHRSKNAERLTQKVEAKYGVKPNAVAHSLGGKLIEDTSAAKKITYNKAVGVGDLFKKLPSNQLDVRSQGDIISLPSYTQSGGKRELVKNKNKNPLYAHSVKPLLK
jgi:hypothetical protein